MNLKSTISKDNKNYVNNKLLKLIGAIKKLFQNWMNKYMNDNYSITIRKNI
jgi:hypothetical protein